MRVGVPVFRAGAHEGESSVLLEVGAGESWDDVVLYAVDRGYAGIECLAGIPGDVGGTPVQNVGAYGQEVAETIDKVRAYDLESREASSIWITTPAASDIGAASSTRTSAVRYIVTAVTYRLRPGGEPRCGMPISRDTSLPHSKQGAKPTLRQVYDAVRSIREQKGMLAGQGGPDGRSAGSFFKNPVVPSAMLCRSLSGAGCKPDENVPHIPEPVEGKVKLPAAWLVEQCRVSQGLCDGPRSDLLPPYPRAGEPGRRDGCRTDRSARRGGDSVEDKFGVRLEQEPVHAGFPSTRGAVPAAAALLRQYLRHRPLLDDSALRDPDHLRPKLKRFAQHRVSQRAPASSNAPATSAIRRQVHRALRSPVRRTVRRADNKRLPVSEFVSDRRDHCASDRARCLSPPLRSVRHLSTKLPKPNRAHDLVNDLPGVVGLRTSTPCHRRIGAHCHDEETAAPSVLRSAQVDGAEGQTTRRRMSTNVTAESSMNPPCIRPHKSGDRSQYCRLPLPDGPNSTVQGCVNVNVDIQVERPDAMLDVPHMRSVARLAPAKLPDKPSDNVSLPSVRFAPPRSE